MKQGRSKQTVKRVASGATARKSKPAKVEKLPHYDLSEPDPDELSKKNLAVNGGQRIRHELEEHHSSGPTLTAGDLDADWQSAEAVGDEAVGGHAPTPDQNVVDEIGRAVGFDTGDGEELRSLEEQVAERDRNRWELDRRSEGRDDTDRNR